MSPQAAFSLQFEAFHTAIIDDCDRAAGAERTDGMALRLRNNAVALARLQLAMLAATRAERPACAMEPVPAPEAVAHAEPQAVFHPEREAVSQPERPVEPRSSPRDHVLSGDALSHFVSRRLEPDESPHHVWQDLHAAHQAQRRRNPALPGKGFRSSSG
jgi:hypothetical protein